MKKKIMISVMCLLLIGISANAQNITYTVQAGDTIWKIATRYQAGISEILTQNPSVKNASMIYPGQKLLIPTQSDVKAFENEVVRLVNVERSKRGLQPLIQNWQLSRIARYKSQDMATHNYFSHQSPTYGSPFTMIQNFGIHFSAAGENIAMGQRTPAEVMNGWMNSTGHRANILSPAYTQIGVGLAKNKNGTSYWTQQFIKPL
jgi:uncharacterized YkwD family protein/spore coat assembly protein SafA